MIVRILTSCLTGCMQNCCRKRRRMYPLFTFLRKFVGPLWVIKVTNYNIVGSLQYVLRDDHEAWIILKICELLLCRIEVYELQKWKRPNIDVSNFGTDKDFIWRLRSCGTRILSSAGRYAQVLVCDSLLCILKYFFILLTFVLYSVTVINSISARAVAVKTPWRTLARESMHLIIYKS